MRTADLTIGQRRPAIPAESPFGKVRACKNVGWCGPLDLIGRKSNECHEGATGRFLAHATIADAGTVPRLIRPVSYSPALTAADIRHCLVTGFNICAAERAHFDSVEPRFHLILNLTGTTKDSSLVCAWRGGFGIGWARANIARHSRSSSGEPDVSRMRLSRTHPSRSIVKATRATPWSPRARASAG